MTEREEMLKQFNCEEICVIEQKEDSNDIDKKIKKLKSKKNCLC